MQQHGAIVEAAANAERPSGSNRVADSAESTRKAGTWNLESIEPGAQHFALTPRTWAVMRLGARVGCPRQTER